MLLWAAGALRLWFFSTCRSFYTCVFCTGVTSSVLTSNLDLWSFECLVCVLSSFVSNFVLSMTWVSACIFCIPFEDIIPRSRFEPLINQLLDYYMFPLCVVCCASSPVASQWSIPPLFTEFIRFHRWLMTAVNVLELHAACISIREILPDFHPMHVKYSIFYGFFSLVFVLLYPVETFCRLPYCDRNYNLFHLFWHDKRHRSLWCLCLELWCLAPWFFLGFPSHLLGLHCGACWVSILILLHLFLCLLRIRHIYVTIKVICYIDSPC